MMPWKEKKHTRYCEQHVFMLNKNKFYDFDNSGENPERSARKTRLNNPEIFPSWPLTVHLEFRWPWINQWASILLDELPQKQNILLFITKLREREAQPYAQRRETLGVRSATVNKGARSATLCSNPRSPWSAQRDREQGNAKRDPMLKPEKPRERAARPYTQPPEHTMRVIIINWILNKIGRYLGSNFFNHDRANYGLKNSRRDGPSLFFSSYGFILNSSFCGHPNLPLQCYVMT
jgi:hypothetical protein